VRKALPKMMLMCGLVALTGYAVSAQTTASTCAPMGRSYGPMGVNSRTGCPFSAVVETVRAQALADGTHIQRQNKTLVYRDSMGRIRYEMYAPTDMDKAAPEAPNMIEIYDPVAGFSYVLLPPTQVARRFALNAPARTSSTATQEARPQPVFENLGTQEIEGFSVTGTRATRTIPADAEGNDRAITVVSENWRSEGMGITLLQKGSDPRSGDAESRMTNVESSEPDAALFQVPADYTIKD
jgi:hypothetical protein